MAGANFSYLYLVVILGLLRYHLLGLIYLVKLLKEEDRVWYSIEYTDGVLIALSKHFSVIEEMALNFVVLKGDVDLPYNCYNKHQCNLKMAYCYKNVHVLYRKVTKRVYCDTDRHAQSEAYYRHNDLAVEDELDQLDKAKVKKALVDCIKVWLTWST